MSESGYGLVPTAIPHVTEWMEAPPSIGAYAHLTRVDMAPRATSATIDRCYDFGHSHAQ